MSDNIRDFFIKSRKEDEAARYTGWELVSTVTSQFWVRMIGLNLLYLLCCLPVVTIPASTCAMTRVVLNLVREKGTDIVAPFFAEFRHDFWKRTGFGLLLLIAPLSLSAYPLMLGSKGGFVAVFVICMILYFCITRYFYPLVVLMDVPLWSNFKNACIMSVLEWRTTLRMLATAGVLDLTLFVLTSYAAPLFIIFLCVFNTLVCCAFFNAAFAKYFEKEE